MTHTGRGRPDVTPKVSRQVSLIVEANTRCHLRDRLPVEEAPSRSVDPSRHEVTVRGDPEGASEAPHEMRGGHVEDPPSLGEGHGVEAVLIEKAPEIRRDLAIGALDRLIGSAAEMLSELRAHDGEHGFGFERLVRIPQHTVKCPEAPDDRVVLDVWIVNGSADQRLIQHVGSQVESTRLRNPMSPAARPSCTT